MIRVSSRPRIFRREPSDPSVDAAKSLRTCTFLLGVLQFCPQNPSYKGAKISDDPVQSVCSQGVLAIPLLVSILRS